MNHKDRLSTLCQRFACMVALTLIVQGALASELNDGPTADNVSAADSLSEVFSNAVDQAAPGLVTGLHDAWTAHDRPVA